MNNENNKNNRGVVQIEGFYVAAGNTTTWQGLIATFLSVLDVKTSSRELYKRTLTQYFQWVNKTQRQLSTLTRKDVLEYRESLLAAGKSPLTTGSYIVVVRKFYEWAEAEGLYPNIAKAVKTPKRSDRDTFIKQNLSDTKSYELLEYFRNESLRNFAIVNLILRTGLRTIEVVRANVEDITFIHERRVLKVWGKGHDSKDDFVVLTEKAYAPIREYLESRGACKGNEPLFLCGSNRNAGGRLTTRTISAICKEGLKAIGLDGKQYSAHALRHTAGCSLIQHGAHIDDVMRTMRHSSPDTTMRYVKKVQQEEHLKNPVEELLDNAF